MSIEHASEREVEHLIHSIPEELQEYRQFVGWEVFSRAGKPTKVPLNPHTGYYASVADPESWGSIRQALRLVSAGKARGIGFVFSEEDPYAGTDLDHCITDGQIDPWAQEIVTHLNSYAEYSPSGTGLHIITQADIPQGRRKDQTEMYASGRYFTLTGRHLPGTPEAILPRQSEQEALYRALSPARVIEIYPGASQRMVPLREDDEILKKALEAKNSEKFLKLWQGDFSGHRSKSEAKFDLILRILYWDNFNVEQTKRLYRQSALYDEKDETLRGKSTYLDYNVEAALRKRRLR